MIVVDASAAVLGLLNDGEARNLLGSEPIACPHLVDSEVVSTLRAQVLKGEMEASQAAAAIGVWAQLGIERMGVTGLLSRIWELRDNVSAYDTTYVALAEALEVPLVTADGRLARAPGLRCTITTIRT